MTATVLTITPQSADLSVCNKGVAISTKRFANSAAGRQDLSEHLQSICQIPMSVLVNSQDEDFRLERLPHTTGAEKSQLWQRKLEQLYPNQHYISSVKQGRSRDGRKDDEVLFSAFTNPQQLTAWLNPIRHNKIPLRGIYSLPLVSESLVKHLAPNDDYVLLLTLDNASGLRQSFFVDGKLKFSRLLPEVDLLSAELEDLLRTEITNVRRYVENQQLLPRDRFLKVCVISQHADSPWLETMAEALPLCTGQHYSVDQVFVRTDAKSAEESYPTVNDIFTNLVLKHRPKHNFARTKQQTYWHLRRASFGLYAASLIIVLSSIFLSISYVTQAMQLHSSSPNLLTTQNQLQNELTTARQNNQPITENPAHLEQTVLTARTLDNKVSPAIMMRHLSQSLEHHPNIQFRGFKWLTADHARVQPDEYEFKASKQTATRLNDSPATRQAIHQTAEIHGEVVGFKQDWQKAMDAVQSYIETLRNVDQIERVGILTLPINTDSKRYLSGSVQATKRGDQPAHFALRVVLKDHE